MLLGRSLLGGTLFPRQFTGAGGVACAATGSGAAVKGARCNGGITAGASNAGYAVRGVLPAPVAVTCVASRSGAARKGANPTTLSTVRATATARARTAVFGLAAAVALAACSGAHLRTTKAVVSHARPAATCIGTGETYVVALGDEGFCQALPFGTTWYVGRGDITAGAAPVGAAQRIRQARGDAAPGVAVTGVAKAALLAAAVTGGHPTMLAHPRCRIAGVWNNYALGEALATASGAASAYQHSVLLAVGRCTLGAAASKQTPFHAAVLGRAIAQSAAEAEIKLPTEAQAAQFIVASASGDAHAEFSAFADVLTLAVPNASAATASCAGGEATGAAEVMPLSAVAGAAGDLMSAAGTAAGIGDARMDTLGGGSVVATTWGAAIDRRYEAGAGTQCFATATLGGIDGVLWPKIDISGECFAVADGSDECRLAQRAETQCFAVATPGDVAGVLWPKIDISGGCYAVAGVAGSGQYEACADAPCSVVATVAGAITVGNPNQRLSVRVVRVPAHRRSLPVPSSPRRVIVSGSTRRVAV